jgi:hypothetical protein
MASIKRRPDGQWPRPVGRLRRPRAREALRRKADGQRWLDERTAALLSGTHVDPKTARTTVKDWCDTWLVGYGSRRSSTVRQARVHVAQIVAEFGGLPLASIRPSQVGSWTTKLGEQATRRAPSTRCTRG